LTWAAPATADVATYRVYYGTAPRAYFQALGNGVSVGSATTYTASNLSRGITHYFAVTAIDSSGNESDFSTEVSKQIP
jgi:hypothetical protein